MGGGSMKRAGWWGVIVLVLGIGLPAGAQAPQGEEPDEEHVYLHQVSVDQDGTVVDSLEMGSMEVTLDNQDPFLVDPDHLRDPDGNRYTIEGGIFQEGPGEPLTYEIAILRYTPEVVDEEQAVTEFLETSPGATQEEIDEFLERWNPPGEAPPPSVSVDAETTAWIETAAGDELLDVRVALADAPPLDLPGVSNALLDTEPALWLAAMEARQLANEERKTEIYALQDDLLADLDPDGCTVRSDAVASGACTVGSIKKTGDLDTAKISCADWDSGSSRGGDGRGRPLLKIVAPCGREGTNNARLGCFGVNCYHVYGDGSCGTSTACPMVVGAAANLEDFLLTHYPLGTANDAGLIYAIMLLMGDGTTESGVQAETTPIDELWGVGRMRMRLFTEAGMDAPWRWGFKIAELDHGETMVQPINVARPTGNQPVPSQARWFRAALWFYEPNIASPYYVSQIRYRVTSTQGPRFTCSSLVPQSQRLWMDDDLAGNTWTLEAYGQYVPASWNDLDDYYLSPTRLIYSTYYWEDRDRNDPDGPAPEDNIYWVATMTNEKDHGRGIRSGFLLGIAAVWIGCLPACHEEVDDGDDTEIVHGDDDTAGDDAADDDTADDDADDDGLGDDDTDDWIDPSGTYVSSQADWVEVACATKHTCARRTSGAVECWGSIVGHPIESPQGSFQRLAAGRYHVCAQEAGGAWTCWGCDSSQNIDTGQCDVPAVELTAVSGGQVQTCGLDPGGEIHCWGCDDPTLVEIPTCEPPSGVFVSIGAGFYHTCAIDAAGSLVCWDSDAVGELSAPQGSFQQVGSSYFFSCALTTSGEILCWGLDELEQLDAPPGTYAAIATGGGRHSCALDASGSLTCWGQPTFPVESPPGEYTQVSTGAGHACAVRNDGYLVCWGANGDDQAAPP